GGWLRGPLFRIPGDQFHRHRRIHGEKRGPGCFHGRWGAGDLWRAYRVRLQRRSVAREDSQGGQCGGAHRGGAGQSPEIRPQRGPQAQSVSGADGAHGNGVQRTRGSGEARRPRGAGVRSAHLSGAGGIRRQLAAGAGGHQRRQALGGPAAASAAQRVGAGAGERRGGGPPQRGHAGGGGRMDLDYFQKEKTPEHFAHEAAREAIAMLDAVEAPAGEMTVVLGPGWPGILLHEAVGHGLEADFNRKGVSAFSGRMGQKVASELCTVVDDGTIGNRRGSLNVDDEGQPTQRNVLIENGVLCGYLQDKLSSRLLGAESTGSGRRESYAHIPMPRMTNTFMMAGESDPEEIVRSVPKGLYCVNFGGGQVDITSGNFVFSASESYLIEDGKLTRPVRNATLIGNGPEALKYVSMVGNDLRLDEGIGTCGKAGQSVPVGVGIPTI